MQAAMERVLVSGLVDTADVARVLKTTPRSVQRWSARGSNPRKESEERLLELAVVLELAAQALPEEGARLWLRTPIADLGWRKPLDVVGEGNFREVIDSLEALSEGVIQ
jgi:putative toxin-antitoxin system antitoxin component (TIGR02293 family)